MTDEEYAALDTWGKIKVNLGGIGVILLLSAWFWVPLTALIVELILDPPIK